SRYLPSLVFKASQKRARDHSSGSFLCRLQGQLNYESEALLRFLLHQLLHHAGRHVLVVVELHGESAAAADGEAQKVDVAEHFRQQHEACTSAAVPLWPWSLIVL